MESVRVPRRFALVLIAALFIALALLLGGLSSKGMIPEVPSPAVDGIALILLVGPILLIAEKW